jgi:hypothetical protein
VRWSWKLKKPKSLTLECINPGAINTWEKWERTTRKRYPIRFFLQERLPLILKSIFVWKIQSMYWWVRYHTVNRYHVIDIGSKENGWTYGYSDTRELMLYAMFSLLVDFVEGEADTVCWDWNDTVLSVKIEMDLLYNWWKYERPNRTSKQYGEGEIEDTNNLTRLVNIREYLWA